MGNFIIKITMIFIQTGNNRYREHISGNLVPFLVMIIVLQSWIGRLFWLFWGFILESFIPAIIVILLVVALAIFAIGKFSVLSIPSQKTLGTAMHLRLTFLFFILLFSAFFFSSSSACNNSSAFLDASWKQTNTQLKDTNTPDEGCWGQFLQRSSNGWRLDGAFAKQHTAQHSGCPELIDVERELLGVGNHSQCLLLVYLTICKRVDLSSLPPSYLHTSNALWLGVAKNGVHKNFRHFGFIGIHHSLHAYMYHNT